MHLHYSGNKTMSLAHSKVTAQGQISVPMEIRRKLGISPGSILEWDEDGGQIVVRRSGRFTSQDIHKALFGDKALQLRTLDELKEGVRKHVRTRHARD
jgi:AbrB family looped-hinge helix DNA binding protein